MYSVSLSQEIIFISLQFSGILKKETAGTSVVMSTIPKRKYKRSDIEANYRNESKTF